MKNKHLGWNMKFLIAAIFSFLLILSFNACKNADDEKNEEPTEDTGITWESVFVPDDLSGKTLSASYTGAYSDSSASQGFTEKGTYAIFLYSDGTFAQTYKGTYTTTSTNTTKTVTKGVYKGTYTKVSGDYSSGDFTIIITMQWDADSNSWSTMNQTGTVNLRISNGAFRFNSISYGKTEIKESSSSGSGGSGSGGNDSGGASTVVTVPSDVYLPDEFKSLTISALYTANYMSGSSIVGKYALFLFSDGSFVDTYKTTSYGSGGYYKGTWEKISGNFTTGIFTITVTHQKTGSWQSYSKTGTGTATNGSIEILTNGYSPTLQTSPYTLAVSNDSQSGTASGASATLTNPSVSGTYNLLTWTGNTHQGTINFSTNSMTWDGETGSHSFSYSNGVLTTTYGGQNYTACIKSLSDGKIVFLEPLTRTSGSGLYATFTELNGTDTITLNSTGTFTIGDDSGTWSNSNGIIETVRVYPDAGIETHYTVYYLYDGRNFYEIIGRLSK